MLAITRKKHVRKREESYSTDVEEFSESGGTDYSEGSRISSNDSDGNEELGVQPYLYELEDDGSPERRQSDSDDEEHVTVYYSKQIFFSQLK